MEDNGSIVIYESEGGDVRLDVRLENGTVWLTQVQMSLLYGKAVSTINEHIGDIFADEELSPDVCRKKFGNSEFQQKAPFYYNLDLINRCWISRSFTKWRHLSKVGRRTSERVYRERLHHGR